MDFRQPLQAVIPGVQGRILAVLAETTRDLNLRAIASLAQVSPAQASRVLPELTRLGIVERREAPPSVLFRMVDDNIVSRLVRALGRAREAALDELGHRVQALAVQPLSIIVFGSFARGEADGDSDLDVVFVRPARVDDDETWVAAVEDWRQFARRLTGNRVEIIEAEEAAIGGLLRSRKPMWVDIAGDGVVVFGAGIDELRGRRRARQPRTRAVTPAQVRSYVKKAHEYLDAATHELGEGRTIASTSLAIHAAINASDALTGARVGRRAAGQDHDEVLSLLGESGADWATVARIFVGFCR